jgi:hypothetical protein
VFYNHDAATSYIFTADHGMSDRGSHGDGHPDNTETPLVAWGAGIAGPKKGVDVGGGSKEASNEGSGWGLEEFGRVDVNQADIAPLMVYIIYPPIHLCIYLSIHNSWAQLYLLFTLIEQFFLNFKMHQHDKLTETYRAL